MAIDKIGWHWDAVNENVQYNEHLERAGAHIGYYIEWAYKKGFAPDNSENHDLVEYQKVVNSEINGFNFLISNCDTKFWEEDLNEEGLKFTKYVYDEYVSNLEKIFNHKPYIEGYNQKDLQKVFDYLDKIYDSYEKNMKFIPKTEQELVEKMKENNFKGEYYVKNNIVYWKLYPKEKIQIILHNQDDETYVILPDGNHVHIEDNKIFEYLMDFNELDEEYYIEKHKRINFSDILTMIGINVILFGSVGAVFDGLKKGENIIEVLIIAVLFFIIDILVILYFIKYKEKY